MIIIIGVDREVPKEQTSSSPQGASKLMFGLRIRKLVQFEVITSLQEQVRGRLLTKA